MKNFFKNYLKNIAFVAIVASIFFAATPSKTFAAQLASFTTPGTYTWQAPTGVTSVTVKVWGAGGGGTQTLSALLSGCCRVPGSGGAGGGLVVATIPVTPGATYNITIGAAGVGASSVDVVGGNGFDSIFASQNG